ncbi:MAG: YihY/virulence factor BrkB family protein [Desulfobulbus sp.]|nr:MAG: YihY/virulence factor BrkB family protein [Desulfobulbus sp.]
MRDDKDAQLTRHSWQTSRLVRWAFARQREENRLTTSARSVLRVLIILVQEFFSTHITLRASALTFTIILSLVPLLAMSTAILKGLGSDDQLQTFAYRLIDQLDPQQETIQALPGTPPHPETKNTSMPASTPREGLSSLNAHLHSTVDTIFNYVHNTNFAALGAFGIIGLLIAVIMVFSSMEEAMNSIWHTRRGRSILRKMMDYLALLILLPISINIAIAGEAVLHSPGIMGYISTIIPSEWAIQMLFKLLPFAFITLTLMMMYLFFPHVRVKTIPALCGAVFASVFWFIVQRGYIILQIGVAKYNAIYGSFATVPLLLIWIQLGWTFILLGSVLAYSIQNRNHYKLPGLDNPPRQSLQRAFDIILAVYTTFSQGNPITTKQLLADFPGEAETDLEQTVELLVQGKLLHKTRQNGASRLLPAKPMTRITSREIVHLVLGRGTTAPTAGGTLADLVLKGAEQSIPPEIFPAGYCDVTAEKHPGKNT